MNNAFLSALVIEVAPQVEDRVLAKITATGTQFFLDFRLPNDAVLMVSLRADFPAVHFIERTQSPSTDHTTHAFALCLRKYLKGSRLLHLTKLPTDRIIRLTFEQYSMAGDKTAFHLIFALTGKSANAYLMDSNHTIMAAWKENIHHETDSLFHSQAEQVDSFSKWLTSEQPEEEAEIAEGLLDGATFDSVMKEEFRARCTTAASSEAWRSLIKDAFIHPPVPLIYSQIPLEEIGECPLNLKSELRLSHFDLVQANHLRRYQFSSLSEAAYHYSEARRRAQAWQSVVTATQKFIKGQINRLEDLLKALEKDRKKHESPERLKRYGDLLLANLATAQISNGVAKVVDFFDERQAEIEIKLERGLSIQDAAASYFARYQKANRALKAIEARQTIVLSQLDQIRANDALLEEMPTLKTCSQVRKTVEQIIGRRPEPSAKKTDQSSNRKGNTKKIGRWFQSSDGFEIVVGKNDRDNDLLTFRLARSQDIWMHAADYPGSHVVVRNPDRKPVPHRTLFEAAQIAAFYSQAREHPKAAVHYTEKKFVSKPPRAKPGLVRLSSFKTLLVEPAIRVEKIE